MLVSDYRSLQEATGKPVFIYMQQEVRREPGNGVAGLFLVATVFVLGNWSSVESCWVKLSWYCYHVLCNTPLLLW